MSAHSTARNCWVENFAEASADAIASLANIVGIGLGDETLTRKISPGASGSSDARKCINLCFSLDFTDKYIQFSIKKMDNKFNAIFRGSN